MGSLSDSAETEEFRVLATLLRLSTEYQIHALRSKTLKQLLTWWPTTLAQWEIREKHATTTDGVYTHAGLPHPS